MKQPAGNLRNRQKAETRKLILKNARILFETLGYEKTTIRGIASHAGIGLGTIYKHFSQKSDVLAASFCDDIEGILENVFSELPEDRPLIDKVLHVGERFYSFYAQHQKMTRMYLQRLYIIGGEGKAAIDGLDSRFLVHVGGVIEEEKAVGRIRKEIDSGMLALSLFSHYLTALGVCFFKVETFDPGHALELLKQLVTLTLNGVAEPEKK